MRFRWNPNIIRTLSRHPAVKFALDACLACPTDPARPCLLHNRYHACIEHCLGDQAGARAILSAHAALPTRASCMQSDNARSCKAACRSRKRMRPVLLLGTTLPVHTCRLLLIASFTCHCHCTAAVTLACMSHCGIVRRPRRTSDSLRDTSCPRNNGPLRPPPRSHAHQGDGHAPAGAPPLTSGHPWKMRH